MTNEQIQAEALRIASGVSLPLAEGIALMNAIAAFGREVAATNTQWTPEMRAAARDRMRASQPALIAARAANRAKRAMANGGEA